VALTLHYCCITFKWEHFTIQSHEANADNGSSDPRVARSKAKILSAAADILTDQGAGFATIERVAQTAGVARTTVYRHWSTRGQLLMDAFEMMAESAPEAKTTDLRAGLIEVVTELAWALTKSSRAKMLPALIDAAERDADVAELQARHTSMRRAPMRKVITLAQERGEIPANLDPELATDQLSGPLFYRRLITHSAITSEFVDEIVDSVIAGWQRDAK
jgi:AcrR family transcriptional regulator